MAQGGWNPPPGGPPGGYPQQPPGGYAPPPQQHGGYQPPPMQGPPLGGPPGGLGGQNAQDKGFVAGLFDFSFETFVALKVVKVLYGIFLLALVLGILIGLGGSVISMIQGEVLAGIGMLIATPIFAVIYLVMGRVYFELIIISFKIAEDADEIAKNTRK